ncbi:hypothetical protein BK120_20580 [Paenibacillus sp. FSL A5-0031]|nr:hypothetical protein BK120_20580 [Paenibacillus sp. FSL A5-0031]
MKKIQQNRGILFIGLSEETLSMYEEKACEILTRSLFLLDKGITIQKVRIRHILRRRTWRERVRHTAGKDPLVCPKCECDYEYKGEVCLQEGKLRVKYARCRITHVCLERMIRYLTGVQEPQTSQNE